MRDKEIFIISMAKKRSLLEVTDKDGGQRLAEPYGIFFEQEWNKVSLLFSDLRI